MKYWLDTEFIERGEGKPIDLISIGFVAEDGRELYCVSTDFKARYASPWVKENVIAKLPSRNEMPPPWGSPRLFHESMAWMKRDLIRKQLIKFIGDDPEPVFIGWCCGFDYVVVSQLIGFHFWPSNWPYYFVDIQQIADGWGVKLESQPCGNHSAIEDARWIRRLCEGLHP